MATKISTIIGRVRENLHARDERFWSNALLLGHVNSGIKDLARALNSTYQNFFFDTNPYITYEANADRLSNVPANASIILGLELANPALYPALKFDYADFNSDDFITARAAAVQSPSVGGRVLFCATGAGAPTGPPTIHIAPRLDANLTLRLTVVPSLADRTADDYNPIPGESDKALECWATAFARAKLREAQTPDPDWLALYATEKTNIIVAITPRQEVTDQVAESPFGEY